MTSVAAVRRTLLVLAAVLAACSSNGDDNGASAESTTTTEVGATTTLGARPADEVLEEAGRDADGHPIETGEVSGPAIVINGVALSVESVGEPYADPDVDGGGRWIDLEVRAENLGDEETTSPDFLLQCAGENQAFYAASTYDNGSPLPPDSFVAGTIVSDYPEGCESPTIVVEFVVTFDSDPVAHWPL